MKAKPKLEHSMQEEQIRTALNTHRHASAVSDANTEHDIYDDDVFCHGGVLQRSAKSLAARHERKPAGVTGQIPADLPS